HLAVADAVGQARQQQAEHIVADALRRGEGGVAEQRQRQRDAQALRRGQQQRQQGAKQIADVVPGGQPRALFEAQQAIGKQVRQQRGIGEAAQGMDNDQGGAAGEQGKKDLAGRSGWHFLYFLGQPRPSP